MSIELDNLKARAKELGISYSPNIGEEALRKKIEELNYTPQDILLKRDIDYINRVKLKDEYEKELKPGKTIQEKKKQT